ncbi:hypothetical protein BAY59_38460 (plasmid) [Prauserella coralliicola]|nr:hypothetical protein BAY59_38460 [Prauserella coralliicola]
MGTGRPLAEALLGQSEIARRLQQFALLGAATLALLLTWFSGWYWWPWLWALIPVLVVILPGIRRLVDESWGLIAGLLVVALSLSGRVEASTATLAWSLAAAVTAGAVAYWRRGGLVPLAALGVTLVALVASVAVWWSGKAERDAEAARQAQLFHEQQVAKLRPRTPRAVVYALVEAVGYPADRAERTCIVFDDQAARQFAASVGAPDCAAAFHRLSEQVRDRYAYVNEMWLPYQAVSQHAGSGAARVDACQLEWGNVLSGEVSNAGPQLGRMDMVQQYGEGYLVTRFAPCR